MSKRKIVIGFVALLLICIGFLLGTYFKKYCSFNKRNSAEFKSISDSEARVIAGEVMFKPGTEEAIGCDPRRLSNSTVHHMDERWTMVTLDAIKESRRI